MFANCENQPPISYELYAVMRVFVPKGSTILELGSGDGSTTELSKHYDLRSIEHNPDYVGKWGDASKVMLAEIVDGFYDKKVMDTINSIDYKALLVDGPDWDSRMVAFNKHLHYFNPKIHWFFDDMAHDQIMHGILECRDITGRELIEFNVGAKKFAVLLGEGC